VSAPLAGEADRAALAEVLARPEFHPPGGGAAALRQLLLDLWNALLERLGTAEAGQVASLGRLVFFGAVGVALLLAWRAVRRRARRAPRPAGPPVAAAEADRSGGAADGAASAAERLARGDLTGAVRAAFAAAAAGLTARGLAPQGAALTGRELAALARDEGFDRLAVLHERTLFGRRPVSRQEALGALETARRIQAGEGRS
jgi:hypothetical protein